MTDLLSRLHKHTSTLLEYIDIDEEKFTGEGLGMRPLLSVDHLDQKSRRTVGRRMYRLGQWTEIIQGANWVSVSLACLLFKSKALMLQDPASEVYKYYCLAAKIDDSW